MRTLTVCAMAIVAIVATAVAWSTGDRTSSERRDNSVRGGEPVADRALGALGPWPKGIPRPRAVLRHPIDPRQQTALDFGERSHWFQPWRAYLDTVPAASLQDSVGVNFNVAPGEADATARLLASVGVRRARVELSWDAFNYADPRRLTDPRGPRRVFRALARHGIRPLVLLNANHGAPCPTRFFQARLVASARGGDRTVRLDRRTADAVVPGRTGLNAPDSGKAADILFTSIDGDGLATLSKPLPHSLSAGEHAAATLRYAPFEAPRQADGRPNPDFESTLKGWLSYVAAATNTVRRYLGSTRFDVEIWNELSFGSDFLYARSYFDPPPEQGLGDVTQVLLNRTVAFLRKPERGLAQVGIANGFASTRPWDSGATSPSGLSAIAKHPYAGLRTFPGSAAINGVVPVDARGQRDAVSEGKDQWRDRFIPTYTALFPEYFLSAIQTEHLIRDLSPFTTDIYGSPHGRRTHTRGNPPAKIWVTEWNLDPGSGRTPKGSGPLTPQERRIQAKTILRGLVAFVSKGVAAFYIFAASDDRLGVIPSSFFRTLRETGEYPGDGAGGATVDAIRRLSEALTPAAATRRPRKMRLLAIGDYDIRSQFAGDGTPEHPPLYDRDVVAFFPFQLDARRFVVATYVMTRNVASSLRPERFAFAIGGLRSCDTAVSASDPVDGRHVPVRRISCSRRRLVVSLPLTDSPRLLHIELMRAHDRRDAVGNWTVSP